MNLKTAPGGKPREHSPGKEPRDFAPSRRTPPTIIPATSLAAQAALSQCTVCWVAVPGREYDGRNGLCAACSIALADTKPADYPTDIQLKLLKARRLELEPLVKRGFWTRIWRVLTRDMW